MPVEHGEVDRGHPEGPDEDHEHGEGAHELVLRRVAGQREVVAEPGPRAAVFFVELEARPERAEHLRGHGRVDEVAPDERDLRHEGADAEPLLQGQRLVAPHEGEVAEPQRADDAEREVAREQQLADEAHVRDARQRHEAHEVQVRPVRGVEQRVEARGEVELERPGQRRENREERRELLQRRRQARAPVAVARLRVVDLVLVRGGEAALGPAGLRRGGGLRRPLVPDVLDGLADVVRGDMRGAVPAEISRTYGTPPNDEDADGRRDRAEPTARD
mmetsp:Transcript_4005/g.13705  ORF Transcript_4005/g.13705 Transcript_4005/m.13705 type:complete len:275 (-) Transcript_4005:347-1171(-)